MAAITTTRNSTTVLNKVPPSALRAPRSGTAALRQSLRFALLRAGFALGGWVSPASTLRRAFRLFGTPLPGARARALGADTLGATITELGDGPYRIATYTWGDPQRQPVVLFAHGWSSHGLHFAPWVQVLRDAGYAVVSFDHLAHGRSSGHRATLPAFAETLYRLGQHYGPVAALVGHSLGGAAAMLALSRGLRAERVVLIAPAADPVAAAERFGSLVGLAQGLARGLFNEFERRFGISVDGLQAHRNVPHIGRPALIVHDLEDRDVPWSEGERYARYWPQARLLTTTGLGHHRISSDPAVIGDALRFMRGECVGERVVSSPNLPFGIA